MLTDSLKNKVALVTGAGRGIGKEIAKTLASCGAFVIVNYNSSPDAAEQTVKEIIKQGGMAAPVQCDVSDFDACGKMMEMIINNYGHLDILVNNAGITRDGLIMKMSEEDFDRVLDTNLKGAFHTIRQIQGNCSVHTAPPSKPVLCNNRDPVPHPALYSQLWHECSLPQSLSHK